MSEVLRVDCTAERQESGGVYKAFGGGEEVCEVRGLRGEGD